MSDRQTMTAVTTAEPSTASAARHTDLATDLEELPSVDSVHVDEGRTPSHVIITLTVPVMPESVEDLLDSYGAVVEPDSLDARDGTLTFDVTTPERFRTAANHAVRPHGTSLVVTLTRESLDLSGFEEGDELDQRAREGAILLTPHR